MYVHIMLMYIYIHILCCDYIIAANSEMKKLIEACQTLLAGYNVCLLIALIECLMAPFPSQWQAMANIWEGLGTTCPTHGCITAVRYILYMCLLESIVLLVLVPL